MTAVVQPNSYVYSYTEPHPSVPASRKLSVGRGGAGNRTRLCPKSTTDGANATGPASRSPIPSPALKPKRVGRGGAGNVKAPAKVPEEALAQPQPTPYEADRQARLDFAESLAAEKRIWHYGRGGSGNVLNQTKSGRSGSGSGSSDCASVISSISGNSAPGSERKPSRSGSFAGKFADKLRRTASSNQ